MAHLEGRKTPEFPLGGSDGRTPALKDVAAYPRPVADFLAAP